IDAPANAIDPARCVGVKNPTTAPSAISAPLIQSCIIPRAECSLPEAINASAESRITGAGNSSDGDKSTTEPSTSCVADSGADGSTNRPPAVDIRHGRDTDGAPTKS